MGEEIPIWVNGTVHWLSGVDRRTTCRDVLDLFEVEKTGNPNNGEYMLVERWRRVERPLDDNAKILKVWSCWGEEQKDVRLCVRKVDSEDDSGRGSPINGLNSSTKRRRNRKLPWPIQPETLHPKRLAELGKLNNTDCNHLDFPQLQNDHTIYAMGEKLYSKTAEKRRPVCSGTGTLHSTLLDKASDSKCCSKKLTKKKIRNSENIEKLMKLILAQGATIQTQLHRLKNRDQQIEHIEVERHKEREEKLGRNYLLETYLDGLKEAEIPVTDEERGNDSGVHTEAGSEQMDKEKDTQISNDGRKSERRTCRKRIKEESESERNRRSNSESRIHDLDLQSPLKRSQSARAIEKKQVSHDPEETKENIEDVIELKRVQSQVEMWEKILRINKKLEKEEENLVRLHIRIRRIQSENLKLVKADLDPQGKHLEQELETLKNSLDQNSKEIYHNFTELIKEDEAVVQKQSNLATLMAELEETDNEHAVLLEKVENTVDYDIGISLQVKGQAVNQRNDLPNSEISEHSSDDRKTLPSSSCTETQHCSELLEEEPVKPKVLRISFDDNVRNSIRGKPKEHSTCTTVKGILKNRTNDTFNLNDLEKHPVNYGTNIITREGCSKISEKNIDDSELSLVTEPIYSGCVVTTTAMVHDFHSSSASDTSGLSSMYSASPVAEDSSYGTLV